MKLYYYLAGIVVLLWLTACGQLPGQEGQDQLPTPTPLPTPIVPEKPVYTVAEGTVINDLTFTGRVSPVTEVNLSFESSGSVSSVNVAAGDDVEAGAILAELDTSTATQAIVEAEKALTKAQYNLDKALLDHATRLLTAEIGLQKMVISAAEANNSSQNNVALLEKQRAVADAQANVNASAQAYQEALSDSNADQAYIDSLALSLQRAEQDLLIAQANLNQSSNSGGSSATDELDRIQAEMDYQALLVGIGPELQWALEDAQTALENAQSQLQKAQIEAPFAGRVLSVSTQRGAGVEPFKTVIVMAQLEDLEITANLNATDLEKLSVGQSAQIVLTNRPGDSFVGAIRTLPYPYGGGTGSANNDERVVRISLNAPADLVLGELAEVTITLQEKEAVLWLPPAAIRRFQGRDFVVVQTDEGQQRVDVRLGIKSEARVEILEGLTVNQIIVGE